MRAKDLLSNEIPSLRTSDTGVEALNWMEVFRISHMPIVNSEEFLGLVSDKDIYDMNSPEQALGNHKLSLIRPYVKYDQHIYEVMDLASALELSLIPVLDHHNKYLGVIQMIDLLHQFAKLSAIEKPGGIIVLEINQNDYLLTQIAQIVESNDAKILSMYLYTPENSTKLDVTLKINKTDLTSIIQTFDRYDYIVKESFMDYDEQEDLLDERFESFMKFLNI